MKYSREFWVENCHLSGEELARKFDGDGGNWRKRIRRARGEWSELPWFTHGKPSDDPAALLRYMSRGRTEAELTTAGFSLSDARAVAGYDLFETRNVNLELVYLLLPELGDDITVKPQIWTHRWATDTDGTPQPYMMLQMPDRKWDKIKVVPLADLHYGSNSAMTDKLREYVNWIAENDNVFCFLNGDLLENAHGDSCKGVAIYEQGVRPSSQVGDLARILAPIAHKILWAHPGNHEDRSRIRDFDPLERMCEKLNIPYSYEPVYVDVLWKGNVFSFHAKHGNTSSQTKGGKMNAAARPQEFQGFTMFTIMSHVHDGDVSRNTRICRDRVNFRLDLRKQYVIVTPAFLAYFGSYASKAGYKPGSFGAINMDLFANGDYHANS
jgi:hypothetical protein